MESKVQQIEILGHTVNYTIKEECVFDKSGVEEGIHDDFKNGIIGWDENGEETGKWWITDWGEIATELYNELKFAYHNIYTDSSAKNALYEKLKMYEDATGK